MVNHLCTSEFMWIKRGQRLQQNISFQNPTGIAKQGNVNRGISTPSYSMPTLKKHEMI